MDHQLNNIFVKSWEKLQQAKQGKAATRYITICNYADGYPNAYTVVLRDVQAAKYQFVFFTDIRSEKVQEIRDNNKVTIVYYDDNDRIQLILKAEATINRQNDIALNYWQLNGYKTRRSYMANPAPSSAVAAAADGLEYLYNKHFEDGDMAGYENFAVITLDVNFLEYLQLQTKGNRRARFRIKAGGNWMGEWIIP